MPIYYFYFTPSPISDNFDYFGQDVGAMRFPQAADGKPGVMTRLFNLFSYSPLNTGKLRLNDSLVPFYFTPKNNNGFLLYNNVRVRQNEPSNDFRAAEIGVDPAYIKAGADAIFSDVIRPFSDRLWQDLDNGTDDGWKYLQSYDEYSVRAYMSFKYRPSASLGLPNESLPANVVNWCETFSTSTSSFDRSLAQEVFESMAFEGRPGGELKWWRLEYVYPNYLLILLLMCSFLAAGVTFFPTPCQTISRARTQTPY